jgi:hypothetical protein
MPAPIKSWREEILPRSAYGPLAAEWRTWAEAHPDNAFARVQIARALGYRGDADPAEINGLIREALELDPDCPEALDALAKTVLFSSASAVSSIEEAYELGLKAVRAAPDWPDPHYALWTHAVLLGRTDEAEGHLRALLEKGAHPAHILDFGYNLLVSAPENAILLTNGDNDTYPPLELQVARSIRTDVTIVNLSLLNVLEYAESVWDGGGDPAFTADEIRDLHRRWIDDGKKSGRGERFSSVVVAELLDRVKDGQRNDPVAFAITVATPVLEACPLERRLEGIVWRVLPTPAPPGGDDGEPAVDAERTLALFRDELRIDSATDLAFRWDGMPASRDLMRNYPAVLRLAATERAKAGDLESARWALDRAAAILSFHGETKSAEDVRRYREDLQRVRGAAAGRDGS